MPSSDGDKRYFKEPTDTCDLPEDILSGQEAPLKKVQLVSHFFCSAREITKTNQLLDSIRAFKQGSSEGSFKFFEGESESGDALCW